jgi:hypothetical protein
MPLIASPRGMALVVTLLAMALFTTLAGGLVLSAVMGRSVAANHEEAAQLANASDSALELTALELGGIADWNEVLAGARTSTRVDGAPGARVLPGGAVIDLSVMTNELTCGRVTFCTDAQVAVATAERPWGANNPRWRLFMHGALPSLPALPRAAGAAYGVVWLGDDARETDNDPSVDGAGAGQEGRSVVRARVESFGSRGGRHALEAELVRVCTAGADGEACLPGVRVLSWRVAQRRRRRRTEGVAQAATS